MNASCALRFPSQRRRRCPTSAACGRLRDRPDRRRTTPRPPDLEVVGDVTLRTLGDDLRHPDRVLVGEVLESLVVGDLGRQRVDPSEAEVSHRVRAGGRGVWLALLAHLRSLPDDEHTRIRSPERRWAPDGLADSRRRRAGRRAPPRRCRSRGVAVHRLEPRPRVGAPVGAPGREPDELVLGGAGSRRPPAAAHHGVGGTGASGSDDREGRGVVGRARV